MSGGMAMFQSELRSAVREVRATPASQPPVAPAPKAVETEAGPERRVARRLSHPPAAGKRTVVRLWLPLTPLWVLLAPFALLLAPLLLLAPAARGLSPYRTALALGATLIALSGTVVDVDTPDALVRVRIF